MKLVILSLGESLLASSPGFSVPCDRTFNYIYGFYQSKPVSVNNTDKDQLSLPGLINDVPVKCPVKEIENDKTRKTLNLYSD